MKKFGTFKAKSSKEILASKIGIGFECLDRKMWEDTPEVYRLTGDLGVKHARVQTGWSRCEEVKGKYDFRWLDDIVNKLLEVGVQPWFNLGYGNIHHTDAEEPDAAGWPPIYSEESRLAWEKYIAELVRHFKGRVSHYEIWNEPDLSGFWSAGSNPGEYMELLKLTVPVIKENYSESKIIGGAMARGLGWSGFAVLEEYLKNGFAKLIDIYSFHRYHIHPELNRPCDFKALRQTFDAYDGQHIKLWQAESGCPSKSSSTEALRNTPVNQEIQAKVVLRSIVTDLSAGIDYTCYFHMSDFKFYYRNGYRDVPNHFGLITFDTPPEAKQSYYVFQRLCSIFDNQTELAPRTHVNMDFEGMAESKEKYSFQTDIINTKFTAFERKGRPLVAWWLPANLLPAVSGDKPFESRDVNLYVWTSGEDMENPVVIDPMTGDVFEPDNTFEKSDIDIKGCLKLANVPLKDYPMFAADRETVMDIIEEK
jgi:polysaccharide biosynthesis protein PslG